MRVCETLRRHNPEDGYRWGIVAAQCCENVEGEKTTWEAVVDGHLIMSTHNNGNRVENSGKEQKAKRGLLEGVKFIRHPMKRKPQRSA